jgi:hypothetical protein
MGDLLGARSLKGDWVIPKGVMYKVIIWGVIGLMVTLGLKHVRFSGYLLTLQYFCYQHSIELLPQHFCL